MSRLPKVLLCLSSVALLAFGPVSGASAQESTDPALAAAIESFQQRIREGDLMAATAELEALSARPDAPAMVNGMLGGLYVDTGRAQEAFDLLRPLAEQDDADPAVLYNAGRAALLLANADQAERYLARAVDLAPRSPAARELGLLRGLEGRYREAYVLLYPWVAEHPRDLDARLAAAVGAIHLSRAPEAEMLLSDIPQDDPKVRILWGRLLLLQGDPFGAIGYLKPLLAEASDRMMIDVRRLLSEAHLMVGESGQAIEVLDGHVGSDPTLALRLSRAQFQAGEIEAAIATLAPFSEQVLTNPTGREQLPSRLVEELTLEYGRLLVASGRAAEAVRYLELTTEVNEANPRAWQNLGQALATIGERDRAEAALERFSELSRANENDSGASDLAERDLADPTGKVLREAMLAMGDGRHQESLDLLRAEQQLRPGDPRTWIIEARVLLDMEQPEEAAEAARTALEMAPGDADAQYISGATLMAVDQLDQAEQRLRQALELVPEHTAAMSDLAVLLMNSERNDEARSLLRRVLEINPNDPVARMNLEKLSG